MNGWSLTGRLAWIVMALLAVLWLGASFVSALIVRYEILEASDAALAHLAGALLPAGADITLPEASLDDLPEEAEEFAYVVRDAAGKVIARSAGAPEQLFDVPLVSGFNDSSEYRALTITNADQTRWVQVAEVQSERAEAVRESVLGLLWPLALLLVLVALAIRVIIPRLVAPLKLAQNEIAARGAGNLEPIPDLGLPRELAPVVEAVNRLLTRLRKLLEAERAFASNSAHELRTPVAAALAQAQLLTSELQGPARERAASLASQLSRLAHIAEKLLQLSRAEAGVGLEREALDLNRLAAVVAEPFVRHSRYGGRIQVTEAPQPVMVEADLDTLGIALENLIDNAFTHGGPDVNVTVTVQEDGSIAVTDDGQGIDPQQLNTLHERFVRGATSGAGSGLGLAIASMIAEQAGGELVLTSPGPGQGFTSILQLRPPSRIPSDSLSP
jgi:two-component system OmpR family sensor kinase